MTTKKTENLALRVSEPVKSALVHIAKAEGRNAVSDVLLEAILMLLSDRGVSLPADCPEYRVLEAAEGSVNGVLADLITKATPVARDRSQGWATSYAESRFAELWTRICEIDEPRLYNDAYEIFSDPKRTPREKMRALEFRVESLARNRGLKVA